MRLRHGGGAHNGLAGAARQHDDAGSAFPEGFGGVALVVAKLPAVVVQRDWVGLAVDVAGQILHGPTQLGQLLLDLTAGGGVDGDREVVDRLGDERLDLLAAPDLGEDGGVVRLED